jgi:hypothetical protein
MHAPDRRPDDCTPDHLTRYDQLAPHKCSTADLHIGLEFLAVDGCMPGHLTQFCVTAPVDQPGAHWDQGTAFCGYVRS